MVVYQNIGCFTRRLAAIGFEKSLQIYLRAVGSTSLTFNQKNNLIFAKHLNSCCKMVGKIEIVYYEEIKNLPNHPEILLIDVREPNEIQQTGKIPTSINIPLATVKPELGRGMKPEEFKTKHSRDKPCANTTIIFHCRSGRRSQEAAECAVSMGYSDVKNYKGSWNDWAEHEGLPH